MDYLLDIHTHTLASGHATEATVFQMAAKASSMGLKLLGISNHGPATLAAATESYFRSLAKAPSKRCQVEMLYGVELNILDMDGSVDLCPEVLSQLDYGIASLHTANFKPGTVKENTAACIHAMENPGVNILGHPDDEKFPLDYEAVLEAAAKNHVALELNNASLAPTGYRGNTVPADVTILNLCMQKRHPILLASDSHGAAHLGDFSYALTVIREMEFPRKLILNASPMALKRFLALKPR